MAGSTAEIYKISESGERTYAGYARFDENGKMTETRGGYGPSKQGINPDKTGNKATNNKSRLQNEVSMAAARNGKRLSGK